MRVTTKAVYDIGTGACESRESYAYDGPVALCDRSLQQAASQDIQSSNAAAGIYGAQSRNAYGTLLPEAQQLATNAPGEAASDLSLQMGGAQGLANAAGQAQANRAALAAARTGNAASAGALGTADAEAAARGGGLALDKIYGQNALIKQRQQAEGLRALSGIYGQGMRGQIGALGNVPRAITAGIKAGQSGWLQQAPQMMKLIGSGAGAVLGAFPGLAGTAAGGALSSLQNG